MPNAPSRLLLEDMVDYARRAVSYTNGMDFAAFTKDMRTQDAVLRCLELIGEAARAVSPETRAMAPEIPWGSIVATRHILAHHYAKVDLEIAFRAARERAPELVAQLEALLGRLDQ